MCEMTGIRYIYDKMFIKEGFQYTALWNEILTFGFKNQ
jgi:hypothetical protein